MAAIVRVLGDPALAQRLAADGRRRYGEHFELARMVEAMRRVYAEVAAGARA